tara:strand:+ start:1432 stop:1602 length:171 start_codon:yes stop_codon:yes gene_type:complete
MYNINAAYINNSRTALVIPIFFPEIKITNEKIVRTKSTISIFKLNDNVTGSITIGP